jgi:hypothetical protein
MSKLKFQKRSKSEPTKEKNFDILASVIDLTFACLPCTSTVQGLPVGRGFVLRIWILKRAIHMGGSYGD